MTCVFIQFGFVVYYTTLEPIMHAPSRRCLFYFRSTNRPLNLVDHSTHHLIDNRMSVGVIVTIEPTANPK